MNVPVRYRPPDDLDPLQDTGALVDLDPVAKVVEAVTVERARQAAGIFEHTDTAADFAPRLGAFEDLLQEARPRGPQPIAEQLDQFGGLLFLGQEGGAGGVETGGGGVLVLSVDADDGGGFCL